MTDQELYEAALKIFHERGIVTAGLLQRELKVGYMRARATTDTITKSNREGRKASA